MKIIIILFVLTFSFSSFANQRSKDLFNMMADGSIAQVNGFQSFTRNRWPNTDEAIISNAGITFNVWIISGERPELRIYFRPDNSSNDFRVSISDFDYDGIINIDDGVIHFQRPSKMSSLTKNIIDQLMLNDGDYSHILDLIISN